MPFNSDTYYARKWAREAKDRIAVARERKRAFAAGELRPWQDAAWLAEWTRLDVAGALSLSRLSRMYRRHAAERKAMRRRGGCR